MIMSASILSLYRVCLFYSIKTLLFRLPLAFELTPYEMEKIAKSGGANIFFCLLSALTLFLILVLPYPSLSGELNGSESTPIILEIPSSINPVGSGARAMGMGGAFIATADDATAASWNPGGLIQLEKPEISTVYSYFYRTEDKKYTTGSETSGKDSTDDFKLNYLSAVWPFSFNNRNMVLSLNYQHLYDFNHKWQYLKSIASGSSLFDYTQQGDLYALGIALCSEITHDFSLGVTVNWWGDFVYQSQWEQRYETLSHLTIGGINFIDSHSRIEHYEFKGYNTNIGLLWEISQAWRAAGIIKTPFKADIDYTLSDEQIYRSDLKLQMPLSFGLGIAWHPSDLLTLSGDLFSTQWDDFFLESPSGVKISPITGKRVENSNIKSATWLRVGVEYLLEGQKHIIPLRAGLFYDPAPAEDGLDDYFGGSLGIGIACKKYVFDIAYQFRWGNGVAASMPDFAESLDLEEHKIYTSLIIYM